MVVGIKNKRPEKGHAQHQPPRLTEMLPEEVAEHGAAIAAHEQRTLVEVIVFRGKRGGKYCGIAPLFPFF